MADEKRSPSPSHQEDGPIERPPGWKYKGFRVLGKEHWYASPSVQLFLVSMVCFLCPGMFNALSGMGGMGLKDLRASAKASTALYSTFAVVAFFAGTIANRLGLRLTLTIGGIGYCVYISSFLCYAHTSNNGFVIFSGALLGVCAGMLWTAQGAIMMAYPSEDRKGRYISAFWMIFNFGAVIGSLIPLAQNVGNKDDNVTDGTYAGFIVLTFLGAILSMGLTNAGNIVRRDGSKVIVMKNPSWTSEFLGLWETVVSDPWVILLFPLFFSSNTFYTYQLNIMNGAYFTTRTRALNNVLYWTAQIVGALVWGGWAWQKDRPARGETEGTEIDWEDGSKFLAPMFLYFFYGLYDAVYQTTIYWYMGSLSNSGRRSANYAGLYKGLQSAAAAIWWDMDNRGTAYNTIFAATWGTLAGALVFAFPVIWLRIKDTVPIEDDLKNTDATLKDAVASGAAQDREA
ncbi:unnamed protein product [Parascedosporium putredinis]|uniref:MFS general substrate transporter n=1 Tax=Parascedosporium putredinis TaxID=1442378 RepID=A0A9P1MFK7_9PEZI|nr:unnamed protein product [Parascedosporium putredinis]CAI8002544.1 unnamed protein product [Parascedosporium putredinis]